MYRRPTYSRRRIKFSGGVIYYTALYEGFVRLGTSEEKIGDREKRKKNAAGGKNDIAGR